MGVAVGRITAWEWGCGLVTKLEGRTLGLALHSPAAVLPTEVQIHNLCPRGPILRL